VSFFFKVGGSAVCLGLCVLQLYARVLRHHLVDSSSGSSSSSSAINSLVGHGYESGRDVSRSSSVFF
jgi:hypothetical protein